MLRHLAVPAARARSWNFRTDLEKVHIVAMDRRDFLKRTTLAAALVAAPPGLLSACGDTTKSGAATATKAKGSTVDLLKGRVVRSNFVTLNREYYLQWDQGARRAVEALGGVYKSAVDDQNAARQIQHFEQQIRGGEKIFFNAAPDPSTLAPMSKLAAENQAYFTHFFEIPEWGSPFDPRLNPSKYFVSFFNVDLPLIGEAELTEVAKAIGGKGKIVHITGFPGSTPDLLLTAGINNGLKKFPDVKIIASQPGNWMQADSQRAMAGMLRKFGNDIQGVIGQNEDCAIGAAQAIEEAGVKGIPVVTNGGTTLGTKYLLTGKLHATYALHPAWNAGVAAIRAIDAALGWQPTVPERMTLTAGSMITKDNAQAYLDYIQGPDPFDWPLMSRVAHPDDWDPQGPLRALRLNDFWGDAKKPAGFVYPSEIANAEQSGEYDKIDAMYKARYKKKIFGDS